MRKNDFDDMPPMGRNAGQRETVCYLPNQLVYMVGRTENAISHR